MGADEIGRAKASSEKSNKNLLATLNDLGKKVEECNMTLGDFESQKRRLAAENGDLLRVAGDINNNVNMMNKMKSSLLAALDEAKHNADAEARERQLMLGKFKNVEHELDGLKEQLDGESADREDVARQTNKAESEAAMWRQKYEPDAEIADMNVSLDHAQILNNTMEKKAKQFDRVVVEWKRKVDGLTMDLDVAQKEARNASSELFRIKKAYEESVAQLDEVRRENKGLSNEIKDIMDQINEGGHSIHEIDKIRKRLEAEKLELQAALEEAEGALEQEENKVLRAQLELTQVRQEIERRIGEKDEEFMGVKKNMSKAIEGMQSALEQESKGKAEGLRMKKNSLTSMNNFLILP